MIFSNLHTHTTFSDGKNSPLEMIEKAKELSFTSLGFSDHSEKMASDSIFPTKNNLNEYGESISELKNRFEGEINIFCGIEKDSFSEIDHGDFDYVIGSVHFISAFDEIIPIDLSREDQLTFIEKHGRGDMLELARRYYDSLVTFAQKDCFDILGHFDLVNKFSLFREDDPQYLKIAGDALEEVVNCVPFVEVNTGAISRGYRVFPYPAAPFLSNLSRLGGKVVINSDAHSAEGLGCFFDQIPGILKDAGFTSFYQKLNRTFEEIPLNENKK